MIQLTNGHRHWSGIKDYIESIGYIDGKVGSFSFSIMWLFGAPQAAWACPNISDPASGGWARVQQPAVSSSSELLLKAPLGLWLSLTQLKVPQWFQWRCGLIEGEHEVHVSDQRTESWMLWFIYCLLKSHAAPCWLVLHFVHRLQCFISISCEAKTSVSAWLV